MFCEDSQMIIDSMNQIRKATGCQEVYIMGHPNAIQKLPEDIQIHYSDIIMEVAGCPDTENVYLLPDGSVDKSGYISFGNEDKEDE